MSLLRMVLYAAAVCVVWTFRGHIDRAAMPSAAKMALATAVLLALAALAFWANATPGKS